MPLPEWLNTAGRVAGNVAALPLNILGAVAGIQPASQDGWQHPERRDLALQYIPPTLDPEEQFKRLETFRQIPLREWPSLISHFEQVDRRNTEMMQTPEYQALFAQGGPQALQAFGMPLPPHVLAAQDAPLSAESQARGDTAPSLPDRQPQAILPPIPPEELVKRFGAETQLNAMRRPGTEGAMARAAIAKVPLGFEDATAAAQQFGQVAQRLGYLPEISVDASGVSLKMSKPGQQAFESGMGAKRSNVTPLGGGGGGAPTAPAAKPGGNTGIDTADGRWFDLGNGQYADPQGNIHDQLPTGTPTRPATVEPAAPTETPMRGQSPSLSIGNHPDATAADFQLLQEKQQNDLKLEFEKRKAELEDRLLAARRPNDLQFQKDSERQRRDLELEYDRRRADLETEIRQARRPEDLQDKRTAEQQRLDLQLDYDRRKSQMEAQLKAGQLDENTRTKLAKIAAARAFLNVYEQYGLKGQAGDQATGAESFQSTLPDTRLSGLPAAGELLRQSAPVQTLARDPFLQGFRRYQSIARPIIARNLGDDTGNLSETEQAAAAAMTAAASKPELRDAVAQMRAIIDEREKALLAGKDAGGTTSTRPTITPEEARAELRRRGKLP